MKTVDSQTAPAPDRFAHPIDGPLRQAVADQAVAGVVAMATDREGAFYRGAFGVADAETARPMSPDALFRIASMTKPITSVAALQLAEAGRMRLDDPVERHLPAFAGIQVLESFDPATGDYTVRPARNAVTVRHLMTHCSGLGYAFTSPVVRDFKPRPGEEFPVGPLMFEPGEGWLYGTSTDWLGRMIEAVSGEPLDELLRRNILDPLAMIDTCYSVPPEQQARLVATHRRVGDGSIAKDANQPPPAFSPPAGGGGLTSTAADYARFTRMLLNDGALDGVRILAPETVELMGQNQIGPLCRGRGRPKNRCC
jgi:methyl acetate hydrolase